MCVAKELVGIHNYTFKNNEQFVQNTYQDYGLKNVDLQEVDTSGLFVYDDYTSSTVLLGTSNEESLDSVTHKLSTNTT